MPSPGLGSHITAVHLCLSLSPLQSGSCHRAVPELAPLCPQRHPPGHRNHRGAGERQVVWAEARGRCSRGPICLTVSAALGEMFTGVLGAHAALENFRPVTCLPLTAPDVVLSPALSGWAGDRLLTPRRSWKEHLSRQGLQTCALEEAGGQPCCPFWNRAFFSLCHLCL